jgi:hypothetical protein
MPRYLLPLSVALLVPSFLVAQVPAAPNPQAPTLNPVVPLGVQRGTSIDLTLTGTNLADPTGLWVSFPAKVTIPTEANNGKTPTSLKVRLEVPKDAPLGFHTIRLATKRGMSNARLFCIDDLPQVMEVAGNNATKSAQAITAPCVVVGRADAELTDYFKVNVKAKQRLSFEILGKRLGSAFDPQITLIDAAGNEMPGGFSNDAPGLQTDARLTYTFAVAGDVFVAVRDVSHAGGPDFHYRLRVGDFPCATTALPMALKRGSKTAVTFSGPTVDGVAPVEVTAPTDPLVRAIQVAPRGASGLHGWPVMVPLSDLDEQLEKEPNNDLTKPQKITVPGAVTARFETKDDIDHFSFTAKKGQRFIVEAQASEFLSPTEVYMTIKNDKGVQLLATNPAAAALLDFTAAADGDYTITVEHLHSWGGPDEVYRVSVTPFVPEFTLTCSLDRWDVAAGGTVAIPLFLTRAGYAGAIEVSAIGPKGISGTVTIPAGPQKPPNVPETSLVLKAADLPPGPLSFAIVGKATVGGKPIAHFASVRALTTTALGNLPVTPRPMWTQLGLAITEKPPFALTTKADPVVAPGKATVLTVTAARVPGFVGEIALTAVGLPPGVTAAPVKIAANTNEAKVTLTIAPTAKVGPLSVVFQGAAKHAGRDWVVKAAAAALTVQPVPKKK